MSNSFDTQSTLDVNNKSYEIFNVGKLPQAKRVYLIQLKILLENLLRYEDKQNRYKR